MQQHDACVEAGVAYLETYAPHGYKDRLVLAMERNDFYIGDVTRCALAWAWADEEGRPAYYLDVVAEQNLNTSGTPESYGFCWDEYADLQELQAAWERQIARWQEDQVPA